MSAALRPAAAPAVTIAGPAGRLEALVEEPGSAPARLVAVVCHPHPLFGGTLHNKVVHTLARALREGGAADGALQFPRRGCERGHA